MQMQVRQMVKIIEFAQQYQSDVEQLVLPIQQIEFGVVITREQQPDLLDIQGTFQKGNGNFWLALDGQTVVGCVGIVDIGNSQVALKKMFVHRDFRGQQFGIAALLLSTAKDWCQRHSIKTVFLGTTTQMIAAHRFYQKNGFVELTISQLPPAFPIVHVDTKFYRCEVQHHPGATETA